MADATLTLTTPDGPMECYEATPDDKARGAVIVIQEAFGINDHIRDVTRRAASCARADRPHDAKAAPQQLARAKHIAGHKL